MDAFEEELSTLLVETYRSVGRIEETMVRELSSGKLSLGEMHAISCVGRSGRGGCTITALAQDLAVTLPTATAVAKRLEKKGYVTKQRDARDARQVHIHLTEEGRRAYIAHRYFHRRMVNAARKTVDHGEMDVLLRAVRNINDFFRQKLIELEDARPPEKEE